MNSIINYKVKILIIIVLFFVSCGQSTKYCPHSHKKYDMSTCEVMFKDASVVLIQHSELDINKYYFELINLKTEKSTLFLLHSDITQLGKKGYQVNIIDTNKIMIKLHGSNVWVASDGVAITGHLY